MKKIKLYDYQQKMLEDIINVLTIMIDFAFSEISDCELQRILLESVEYSA